MTEARTTDAEIPPGRGEPEAADAVADRPIETRGQDTMGRRSFAEHLAQDLLAAPRAGFVVALTGAWGSGKMSILNMAVDALGEDAIVIHFNPWMFSGTEALVAAFFGELSKQLGRKRGAAKQIAEKLAVFGRLLSPAAGLVGASGAVDAATGLLAANQPATLGASAGLARPGRVRWGGGARGKQRSARSVYHRSGPRSGVGPSREDG
ncbi:MAG: P-loop NTPase fold protein [Actinomycetota bacterium]|nr:P-loop NTPase fold protein [Actinomycetota bacterium]